MNRGSSRGGAFPDRTRAETDAVVALTEGVVRERLTRREPFTAIDVSNALKARSYPVRHREVAEVVRALWESGLMGLFDYQRALIPVAADGGAKAAQAYLYLHDEDSEDDYDARDQAAAPPVAPDRARSLDDVVAAGVPLSPFAARARDLLRGAGASSAAARQQRARSSVRSDGALPVSRRHVARLGWREGDILALTWDAAANCLVARVAVGGDATEVSVRVWGGLRVRIARTKLGRLAAGRTNADFGPQDADEAAGVLRLVPGVP